MICMRGRLLFLNLDLRMCEAQCVGVNFTIMVMVLLPSLIEMTSLMCY